MNYHMTPFQHRPISPPAPTQFVSGLIPLQSVSNSISQKGWISAQSAASAKLPVGWLVAAGGAYAAYHLARTKEGVAIGVGLAVLAGEALYEILDNISNSASTATASAGQ